MAIDDNYYELSGVERDATQKEIRQRYLELSPRSILTYTGACGQNTKLMAKKHYLS